MKITSEQLTELLRPFKEDQLNSIQQLDDANKTYVFVTTKAATKISYEISQAIKEYGFEIFVFDNHITLTKKIQNIQVEIIINFF